MVLFRVYMTRCLQHWTVVCFIEFLWISQLTLLLAKRQKGSLKNKISLQFIDCWHGGMF